MKSRLITLALGVLLTVVVKGQSFNGFQTIGEHSVFISLSWNGTANIGLGYNYRDFGTTFSDYQLECRIPVNEFNTLNRFQVITGMYRPAEIDRTFIAGGVHLIYSKAETNDLSLSLTAVPGYVYTSDLGDGPYGTVGLLLNSTTSIAGDKAFKSFQFGVGAHVDVSLQRTLGLALNELKTVEIQDGSSNWNNQLSFYASPTWRLWRY
jgi:hypothetical protein